MSESGEVVSEADPWSQLHWWRVPLCFQNVRHDLAREHPVFVMHSLVLYAQHGVPKELRTKWRFHMRHAPGERVEKNAHYHLDWIFPMATEEQALAYLHAMRRYLGTDGNRNYILIEAERPYCENLAMLRTAQPLPWAETEIRLEFFTPLLFSKFSHKNVTSLTAEEFHNYLGQSLHWGACGLAVPHVPPVPEGLELLCHLWKSVKHAHRSRSGGGAKSALQKDFPAKDYERAQSRGRERQVYLEGMQGPLLLRGAWQVWEPYLRLAVVFGLGKSKTLGQGAFALQSQQTEEDAVPAATPRVPSGQKMEYPPLVIRASGSRIDLRGEYLILRNGRNLLAEIPLTGLREIHFHGRFTLASAVLQECAQRSIRLVYGSG